MPAPDVQLTRWFAEEVQPHESSLRGYLRGKFPEHPDIDDLIQETYARLLQAHAQQPVRSARSFLFATARNAAFDFFRRRGVVAIDGIANIDLLPVLEERPGVAETLCHDQELQFLAAGIQALPTRCRQVLTLVKIYGLPHREIAQQLGISEHTVSAQVAIGVLRLRDYLRGRGLTGRKN